MGGLSDFRFIALDTAIDRALSVRGMDLARTEWLKALGKDLHEFRVRHDGDAIAHMFGRDPPKVAAPAGKILLRVFVHLHGEKVILRWRHEDSIHAIPPPPALRPSSRMG